MAGVGAFAWLALGGPSLVPLVFAAVVFLLVTTALIWRDDLRRGRAATLAETPTFVTIGDLAAAGVWMVASAPNERSVAFVLVVSYITFGAIKRTYGLRVSAEEEEAGLDMSEHGMYGYPEQFIPAPELIGYATAPHGSRDIPSPARPVAKEVPA